MSRLRRKHLTNPPTLPKARVQRELNWDTIQDWIFYTFLPAIGPAVAALLISSVLFPLLLPALNPGVRLPSSSELWLLSMGFYIAVRGDLREIAHHKEVESFAIRAIHTSSRGIMLAFILYIVAYTAELIIGTGISFTWVVTFITAIVAICTSVMARLILARLQVEAFKSTIPTQQ